MLNFHAGTGRPVERKPDAAMASEHAMFKNADNIVIRGGDFMALHSSTSLTPGVHCVFHGVKGVEIKSGTFIAGNIGMNRISPGMPN